MTEKSDWRESAQASHVHCWARDNPHRCTSCCECGAVGQPEAGEHVCKPSCHNPCLLDDEKGAAPPGELSAEQFHDNVHPNPVSEWIGGQWMVTADEMYKFAEAYAHAVRQEAERHQHVIEQQDKVIG